ncbi:hypothetical protein [Aminipila terrae]|uniref:DUF2383 domain-containing protein n=1 Tax=Aminipila terrae TaxID=2697030 RepID=A0A6P1MCJ1_9FIRM|nr:hypothetical protein [Aminipila terrae]QHI71617.1 hypothetical protein Ami3637_03780 [Aminipila terrae]
MIYNDTIELLKECNAGIKMAIASIDEILDNVHDSRLKQILNACKMDHEILEKETTILLDNFNDSGKEPNPVAKTMSWIKTNVKLSFDESDQAVADLITDGCNMGVKSLNKFLNKYKAAEANARILVKKLISLEEKLADDIKSYL